MKNFKITFYGNSVYDTLLYINDLNNSNEIIKSEEKTGGIYNCVSNLDDDIKYNISSILDETTSKAYIIIDTEKSERMSFVKWNECINNFSYDDHNSDWNHFMYMDRMMNLTPEKIRNIKGIKSGDMCLSKHTAEEKERLIECIKELDYLIISDNESSDFVEDIEEASKFFGGLVKMYAIVHNSIGSSTSNGDYSFTVIDKYIRNINVLGAGDCFASRFICNRLKSEKEIEKVIEQSHKEVVNFLKMKIKI